MSTLPMPMRNDDISPEPADFTEQDEAVTRRVVEFVKSISTASSHSVRRTRSIPRSDYRTFLARSTETAETRAALRDAELRAALLEVELRSLRVRVYGGGAASAAGGEESSSIASRGEHRVNVEPVDPEVLVAALRHAEVAMIKAIEESAGKPSWHDLLRCTLDGGARLLDLHPTLPGCPVESEAVEAWTDVGDELRGSMAAVGKAIEEISAS